VPRQRFGMGDAKERVRQRREGKHEQAGQQGALILPVVAPIDNQKRGASEHNYSLERAIRIECQRPKNERGGQQAALFQAVPQIEIKEQAEHCRAEARFKSGAGMEKPGWHCRGEHRRKPPGARLKVIPQSQPNAERHRECYQGANAAREPHRARQQRRKQLQVHGQAQVVLTAVLKVNRQQAAGCVLKAARDEVHCRHGLHGFIGEEKDGKFIQLDKAGQQVECQAGREKPVFRAPMSRVEAFFLFARDGWSHYGLHTWRL